MSRKNREFDVFDSQKTLEDQGGKGEMVYDDAAYEMLHTGELPWPALSFDWILDPSVIAAPLSYPLTLTAAIGLQCCCSGSDNWGDYSILKFLRMRELYPTLENGVSKTFFNDEKGRSMLDWREDTGSEEEDGASLPEHPDPIVEVMGSYSLSTTAVHRVRAHPSHPFVAIWTGTEVRVCHAKTSNEFLDSPLKDFFFIFPHQKEGWALDWGKESAGTSTTLVWGCHDGLLGFCPQLEGGTSVCRTTRSLYAIEDVQTSPTEPHIFAAAGQHGTIQIFDTRGKMSSRLTWNGSNGTQKDINVISWNPSPSAAHLVVTGDEVGAVRLWDLRRVVQLSLPQSATANETALPHSSTRLMSTALSKQAPQGVIKEFLTYHQTPINSISWSMHDTSVVAVCSDTEMSIYDFSIEDHEQAHSSTLQAKGRKSSCGEDDIMDTSFTQVSPISHSIPQQILFEHAGLDFGKEVRFHPHYPGVLAVTHQKGIQLLRPCNWKSLVAYDVDTNSLEKC